MDLLRCHACLSPLREEEARWECTDCGAHGEIDAAGVIHLGPPETGGASPAERVGLDPLSPATEASRRISDAISARASSPSSYWSYLASFLPNPAGFAVLGAAHHGTRSLVLASGWGNLPRVIASLGGQVVAMGTLHEGLVYTRLQEPDGSVGCVCSSLRLPLPFADDAFDSVFLDDLATGGDAVEGDKAELLQECARVLRPGGYAVLLTWNRTSPLPHAPSPDLGRAPLDTRPACATKAGFAGLLRRGGFEAPRCFVPWPEHGNWRCMVADSGMEEADLALDGESWKHRVAQVALDLSVALGISDYLVPSHCFVARVPMEAPTEASTEASTEAPDGARPPPASTLEVIARAVGEDPGAIRRLDSHANSNCLSFRTERHFVKIPLTRDASARIAHASRVLAGAPSEMTRDDFIVAPVAGYEVDGLPLGVYPLVPHDDPNTHWADKVERVARALDRLDLDRQELPLGETDFWRRLTDDTSRDEFRLLAPDLPLFEQLACLEARRVPSGLVHGDLAWGNLIRDREARIHLIDWDRCERQSPRFLDSVHACHSLARTWHFLEYPESTADRILEGWERILARDPELPLLESIDRVRGEVSWEEAVALTILNEIDQHHRTLRENPILRNTHHDKLLERLQLAIRHLPSAA
ncbi:MAG: methyltransferase domain-containing protein [Gemmatimonadales bacterium]|nr:MAG: methyltransferase domain-containing protein [Gemmatimonadales bacterium]